MEVPPEQPGDRPLRAWAYRPTDAPAVGAMLVVPGMHFLGPADPRLDRLCAILANAGIVVLAPFLPDFLALRARPEVLRDTERAFDALRTLPERPRHVKPGVMSISFGSLPALRLASLPHRADQLGGLLVFGGYADWNDTVRFCLRGRGARTHDPLNQPVVFMNLLEELPGRPAEVEPLLAAWRKYMEATWGRPEMKAPERYERVARALAEEIPTDVRELFLLGCRVLPGGFDRCAEALAMGTERFAWLDPRPHLSGIRCPVHLVHGRDDDVIPFEQASVLHRSLPSEVAAGVHLTGLYGHSSKAGVADLLALVPRALQEVSTLVAVLRILVRVATVPAD